MLVRQFIHWDSFSALSPRCVECHSSHCLPGTPEPPVSGPPVGWLVIHKQRRCLPLIMELVFNILSTGMPREGSSLCCQVPFALAKAFVETYWLWREFACVQVSKSRAEQWPQRLCDEMHYTHTQRWQCLECLVPFQAVRGSQWNTLGSLRCPSPHLGEDTSQSLFLLTQLRS